MISHSIKVREVKVKKLKNQRTRLQKQRRKKRALTKHPKESGILRKISLKMNTKKCKMSYYKPKDSYMSKSIRLIVLKIN